ncbi:MAG: prolipoprotein diacylglyceryl transferase [Mycoplasmataceae bacterium]|nr:prolipoprotein diacylglyceryl transferase [Mycoplasmataceae bacterium]
MSCLNSLYYLAAVPPPDHTGEWVKGIGPVAFYGMLVMSGFICAIIVSCIKIWKVYKIPVEPFYYFIFIGIPAAILGARIWSTIIGNNSVRDFFKIQDGGLAVEGGVVLTVIAAMIYFPLILRLPRYQIPDPFDKHVRQVSMWLYADAVVPAILLGQFIGRWGNYMNQELYGGVVTDDGLAWFLRQVLPRMYINGEWHQPLFLWEGLINLGGFFIIFVGCEFIPFKKKFFNDKKTIYFRRAGNLAIAYFIWYGIVRIIMEPLRESQFAFHGTIVMSAVWISVGVALLALNFFVFPRLRKYNFGIMLVSCTKYLFKKKTEINKELFRLEKAKFVKTPLTMLYYRE